MKVWSRLLYLGCFVGLGAVTALALDRAVSVSMASVLLSSVIISALGCAPGLIWRKLWPLSILLLPLGCYLLMRSAVPLPVTVDGLGEQMHFYTQQLQVGAASYRGAPYPLQIAHDPGLRLFLAFCTYWVMGASAFLALSLRRPLFAVILLLMLFGYGLTVDASARIILPAVLFGLLSALLFVLCRAVSRQGWRLRDGVAGTVLGLVASLLSLALLTAAPSVAAEPWQDWRTWDPFKVRGTASTFDWLRNYPTLLDPSKDLPVMRVESPQPYYWRASVLDEFTGSAWVTSQPFLYRLEASEQPNGLHVYVVPATELLPQGEIATQSFRLEPTVQTNYFFAGGDPRSLLLEEDLAVRMNSTRALRVAAAMGAGLRYSLTSVVPVLRPTDLVGLGVAYPEGLDQYLALPFTRLTDVDRQSVDPEAAWREQLTLNAPDGWEWEGLYRLNQTIIGGATDPYQITLRVERYLRRFYAYALSPPPSERSSPYAAFLFETRAGYCQHFAGAMSLLLRFNGIPARVAVGFDLGEPDGAQAYLVTTNDAHSWVQAYFPGVGWVDFDPTPGRNVPAPGASSTSKDFRYPFVDGDEPAWAATQETTPPSSAPPPPEEPAEVAPGESDGGSLSVAAWLPWVAGVVVLLLAWPLLRGAWRRRRLHRGGPGERLRASLRLLRAELGDYKVPASPAHTLEETLQMLQVRTGLKPDATLVHRADAVLFGGRAATAEDVRRAEVFRRCVKKRLRERYGWVRKWAAWYVLPRFGGT